MAAMSSLPWQRICLWYDPSGEVGGVLTFRFLDDGHLGEALKEPPRREEALVAELSEREAALTESILHGLQGFLETVRDTVEALDRCAASVFVGAAEKRAAKEVVLSFLLKEDRSRLLFVNYAIEINQIAEQASAEAFQWGFEALAKRVKHMRALWEHLMRFQETKARFAKAFYDAADIEHDCESIRPRELQKVCAAFLVGIENMIKTVKGEQQ